MGTHLHDTRNGTCTDLLPVCTHSVLQRGSLCGSTTSRSSSALYSRLGNEPTRIRLRYAVWRSLRYTWIPRNTWASSEVPSLFSLNTVAPQEDGDLSDTDPVDEPELEGV